MLNQQKERKDNAEAGKWEIVCYQRTINCSQSKSKWWSSSFIYLDFQLPNQRNVVLVVLKENCTFCFHYCPLDLKGFHWIGFIAYYRTSEKKTSCRQLPVSVSMVSKQEQDYRALLSSLKFCVCYYLVGPSSKAEISNSSEFTAFGYLTLWLQLALIFKPTDKKG